MRSPKKQKKPWPTKDAMEQVYSKNLWGGNKSEFYSGIGSHHPEIIEPYIEKVTSFLRSFENPPVVCDLGCGDFNVGKELLDYAGKYIAVDIVEPLIRHNSENFSRENLEFRCLDIAKDELPTGDIAILRQVLQHLSNTEIQSILKKLRDFKYLILTEHLPEADFIPNMDIISGQGSRLKKQSGVDLLVPPFLWEVKEEKPLLTINLEDYPGVIQTTLYKI
ncbi:class I SAM-dependent methyltransferase [Pontixanthobacter gangjinensis]|uniref:Methyltransferase domain-containing protein n=1 Tax=Christiangramia aestuarii TaxID=1028746 RepID=A0A7M3SY00_9FLAO|nr:class I SAM-dependent methyltransferase [Christiangramia aestuarii]MUP41481.1 methyltransferase domain-containing protein [Christiangramia aestuarii]